MVWVRIDDHFDEHPKIAGLDDHAFAMFVAGLAYANRNLTDGFIPTVVGISKLRYCEGKPRKAIEALEAAGLWEPREDGWQIHDFDDYQPTKQQVQEERSKKRAAGQAGGRASAEARAQSNGVAHAQAPATAYASTPAQANGVAKVKPVPVPVPGPVPKTKTESSTSLRSVAPRNGNPRVAQTIDAFRELGIEPILNGRDLSAIKHSNAPPALVAETYDRVARGLYGDDFMRRRLTVHEAIDWVPGYIESQLQAADRTGRGRDEECRLVALGWLMPATNTEAG